MKKILLVMIAALCCTACKKFLSEYSQTDVIPKTTSDYGEILYSDGYPTFSNAIQQWRPLLDDDIQSYTGSFNTTDGIPASPIFQWQPDFAAKAAIAGFSSDFNTWGNYYHLLMGVNVVLQNLDNSTGTSAEKEQYKGEAYALRAFYHFMLVNLYALPYNDSTTTPDKSPGVPIRTTADLKDAPLKRNTVKEVYSQVTSDIDSAVYFLDKTNAPATPYRISATAAHLLASRIYLYMEQWDKAIAHADVVIARHGQLMDLNTWGGAPDPDNKPLVGSANVESIFTYGNSGEINFPGFGTGYNVSHDLAGCFAPDDLRAQIAFYKVPDFLKQWIIQDYSYCKLSTGNAGDVSLGISWRSAEAYLNRAEAYIQRYRATGDASNATQALSSLNTLRVNRIDNTSFQPWTLQPGDTLLQMCRTERRRELFMEENHRWMDLRRYGMPAIKHYYMPDGVTTQVYVLQAHDPSYVLPIPDLAITNNPALVQNPLYSGARMPH